MRRNAKLIYAPNTDEEKVFWFVDEIQVGRQRVTSGGKGQVILRDGAVSGRHCVVTQSSDGQLLIRDISRNGTKVDGRRLVPNVEVPIEPGALIQIGSHQLLLAVDRSFAIGGEVTKPTEPTLIVETVSEVTILVGDIQGYTAINQRYGSDEIARSINRVFRSLQATIQAHGGSIEGYQGDAIVAFWERDDIDPAGHATQACAAALALHQDVLSLASTPGVWELEGAPLRMEWAITTGSGSITTIGDQPTGLAVVGDPVNYAFRLEKLADEETGPILVDDTTKWLAQSQFAFKELGEVEIEGREEPEIVYALLEELDT